MIDFKFTLNSSLVIKQIKTGKKVIKKITKIKKCRCDFKKLSLLDQNMMYYLGFDPQSKIERGDFD